MEDALPGVAHRFSAVLFDADAGILFSGDPRAYHHHARYRFVLHWRRRLRALFREPEEGAEAGTPPGAPCHGSPIKEGFSDRINEIIDRKAERRREVLRAIAAHPYCMEEDGGPPLFEAP